MTSTPSDDQEREKVRELYARYTNSLDESCFEEWVECFTPDGIFESPWVGRHVGRDELLRLAQSSTALANMTLRHLNTDIILKLESDSGTGNCNVAFFVTRDSKIEYVVVGCYVDKLQKIKGQWYFAVRVEPSTPANPVSGLSFQ
jgi:SnoaL-like domain